MEKVYKPEINSKFIPEKMSILIASDIKNLKPWIRALKKTAPEVKVITAEDVKDKSAVEFILAWNFPHGRFKEYPHLKTIFSLGAGVDHLLDDPNLPEKVEVVRIIDPKLSHDMYEFSLAVIMNRLRMLTRYRENQLQGIWKRKMYLRISDVRIGVMGTGVIGSHVASELHKSSFTVSGWRRTPGQPVPWRKYYGQKQLDDFLGNSDILICLLPLTPATERILNKENLEKMPAGSWLINLGRGGHLVDHDLIDLLNSGQLEGANLDVFRAEPLPADHPFWNHPKIFITPHIASLPYPESVAPQIIENYHRTIETRPLLNKVNRELGY